MASLTRTQAVLPKRLSASTDVSPTKDIDTTWQRCTSPLSTASTSSPDIGELHDFSRTTSHDLSRTASQVSSKIPEDALGDGPALTATGQALDLDGGAPIFFACAKELAQGEEAKEVAKMQARQLHAVLVAHAICEAAAHVEDGEVCSIDASGTVYGLDHVEAQCPKGFWCKQSQLLRRRRQKIHAEKHQAVLDKQPILSVEPNGQVSLYLGSLGKGCHQKDHASLKPARQTLEPFPNFVVIVDSAGVVQGCRRIDSPPPVLPACDRI
mmetsp:Transcript_127397/g.248201  ORF Transcript_127397/g.248201 Transcript_127397/m.248201 type:complete len:268 (-) Transcript_127397:118-921(-)|eukprot:CAMPEP_0172665730 /NCGR_PEP_ID=MMETSP1074-20121228/7421_1 /TAXON_ID=2916 /ORGANISM="Ceratium fusus, Strain PA161109" /LENGTH=267 /DNA_ID=CAMNT_0013482071 /DNA_START=17 /DNA_END=820 /DNA_ORIENTATION=-